MSLVFHDSRLPLQASTLLPQDLPSKCTRADCKGQQDVNAFLAIRSRCVWEWGCHGAWKPYYHIPISPWRSRYVKIIFLSWPICWFDLVRIAKMRPSRFRSLLISCDSSKSASRAEGRSSGSSAVDLVAILVLSSFSEVFPILSSGKIQNRIQKLNQERLDRTRLFNDSVSNYPTYHQRWIPQDDPEWNGWHDMPVVSSTVILWMPNCALALRNHLCRSSW